jgi:hypothetical protein
METYADEKKSEEVFFCHNSNKDFKTFLSF